MTHRQNNILSSLLLALSMVAALASCSSDDEVGKNEEQHPIVFSSFTGEQEMVTRAETTLGHDFVVYGYKNVNGNEQTVFNGYTVKYLEGSANTSEDNTHNYYYVEGEQSIKYWDFGATDYHFWGMWQVQSRKDSETNKASFSGDKHNVLTIPNVPLRTGEPDPVDDVLFSSLVERRPVTANVVKLNFNHPYAKVRIQFYTTEPIETVKDNIDITNITFAPGPSATSSLVNKVYGKGTVKVTYPLTGNYSGNARETVSVEDLSDERDNLPFLDVKLTQEYGTSSNNAVTAPINDSEGLKLDNMPGAPLKAKQRKAGEVKYFYYPLPMGEKNPAFILKAYVNGDPEQKTAVVPAEFMQWKPNYQYTYIFKITEVPKKIEIYDVLIEPWHYGGSQEEEWKNW